MKKSILFGAAVALLTITSCKKDYTCECTTHINGVNEGTDTEIINGKKKDAEALCSEGDESETVFGETYEIKCGLK